MLEAEAPCLRLVTVLEGIEFCGFGLELFGLFLRHEPFLWCGVGHAVPF